MVCGPKKDTQSTWITGTRSKRLKEIKQRLPINYRNERIVVSMIGEIYSEFILFERVQYNNKALKGSIMFTLNLQLACFSFNLYLSYNLFKFDVRSI